MSPFHDLGQRCGGPFPAESARSLPSPDPAPAAGRVVSLLRRVRLLSPGVLEASLRHTPRVRISHRGALGRWFAVCLLAAGMQTPLSPPLRAATMAPALTDDRITAAVTHDLLFEENVRLNHVDVATNHGIVTLSRSVDNLLAKERAVRVAESIRGVRGVIDEITVTPASRPDEDIRKDVLAALIQDPATDSYPVSYTHLTLPTKRIV